MAYAAVMSFTRTIQNLVEQDSSCYFNFSDSSQQIIQVADKEVYLLQQALQELDENANNRRTKKLNGLDGEIREAVSELQLKLESIVVSHHQFSTPEIEYHYTPQIAELARLRRQEYLPEHYIYGFNNSETQSLKALVRERREAIPEVERPFIMDLEALKPDIDNFTRKVGELKAAYAREFRYPSTEEQEEDGDDDVDDDYSEMVGLSDYYTPLRDWLMEDSSHMVMAWLGMTGLGKTTLAKKLLHDPLFFTHFHTRVFVSIGPGYKLQLVLLDILRQVSPDIDHQELLVEGDAKLDALKRMIQHALESHLVNSNRYFVVLDDLWDKDLWYRHLEKLFTCHRGGSHVLVTITLKEVAEIAELNNFRIRLLNKKESLDLLREKVFGKELISGCSYRLDISLEKIAENCEGLPLTIVTIGNILSKSSEKTSITYLNEVGNNKHHRVYIDAYDQMFKVLYPNYNYLPQHLKPLFLYMGVFPQTNKFPVHLPHLWSAEGFGEPGRTIEEILRELIWRSLVMSTTITLHPAFWHMCKNIAATDNFFHTLNTVDDAFAEDVMKSQLRLCIHNNVLFGVKYAYDLMASVPNLSSLLCTGPYHQYPVPICLESWRLLGILHATSIRFYEFPMQVLNLIQLRYVSLTYDGNIPSLISKHWSLQRLIINRHLKIVQSDKSLSFLPTEIWDMCRLRHLEVVGSNLPHPPHEGPVLQYLSTLNDVGAESCTRDVFKRMPNLSNLRIQIELPPDAAEEPLCVFDHISQLSQLSWLTCAIGNPVLKPACKALAPLSALPSTLQTLTLSGTGYPWEEMSKISLLPNLTYLFLKCYAFLGPRWEVRDKEFPQLKGLMIEDADLVHLTVEENCCIFEKLESLCIYHCYRLKEIHMEFGADIKQVELIDSNPLAVSCVEQLKVDFDRKYVLSWRRNPFILIIQSSWDI